MERKKGDIIWTYLEGVKLTEINCLETEDRALVLNIQDLCLNSLSLSLEEIKDYLGNERDISKIVIILEVLAFYPKYRQLFSDFYFSLGERKMEEVDQKLQGVTLGLLLENE